MANAIISSLTSYLNTDVAVLAQQYLVKLVQEEKQRVIAEQSARSGGIPPDLESMIVDGRRNAGLGDIRANSRIVLDWNYITEATIKAVEYLRLHGPELSGDWKNSIVVLVDGQEQDIDTKIPPDTAQVKVVVTVPYARKLEVGRTESGRAFSIQVPQHFVENAMMKLRAQMRDLAKFSFNYIQISTAHTLRSKAGTHRRDFRTGTARLGSKRSDTEVLQPCIIIDEIKAIG